MASFKDVLIKDSTSEYSHKHQVHLPSVVTTMDRSIPIDREDPNEVVDNLPDIYEVEILDCEKFENLFLIDKMLGESVPLKTITSKTKADWMPTGEVKFVDMGNGFILIKLLTKWTITMFFSISHGLSKDKFLICNVGGEISILSRNLLLLLLCGCVCQDFLWNYGVNLSLESF